MQTDKNILDIIKQKEDESVHAARRGVIIQPGALGDCILTLPLAQFMKTSLQLGRIDFMGHVENSEVFLGRTCVDGIRSIDMFGLHKLFTEPKVFHPEDDDALISVFSDYGWIVTFLGESGSDFEQNLIFTAHCSHAAEVITLSLKPPESFSGHVSDFYIKQFLDDIDSESLKAEHELEEPLICARQKDIFYGKGLLKQAGINLNRNVVVIQPGSGGGGKSWGLDNYCYIAETLKAKDVEVAWLLGPAEIDVYSKKTLKRLKEISGCIFDLSLIEVLQLLSCCNYFIGNDSGITHLASALGVKTLAVFGASNSVWYKPMGETVEVFEIDSEGFRKSSEDLPKEVAEKILANLED